MKEKQIEEYLRTIYNIEFNVHSTQFNIYIIQFNINGKIQNIEYNYKNEFDNQYNFEMISMYIDYYILKSYKK